MRLVDEEPAAFYGPQCAQPGSRFGHYRLKRLLGKGGFGQVWMAEDTVMDRVVAVKLLKPDYSDNESFRQRLFREARAAGRLYEPHVVPIHHCGEINGQLYIDMRIIDGSDLQAVLAREGPLDPERAVAIVRQIAAALDAAHAAELIHRDVKPANIVLAEGDFAYLLDSAWPARPADGEPALGRRSPMGSTEPRKLGTSAISSATRRSSRSGTTGTTPVAGPASGCWMW